MGTLNTHSKLSDLEKAVLKKWMIPVSMHGVASMADLNAHKDNTSIHFKLKAGDNITISDDGTGTLTVSAVGGSSDPQEPEPLPADRSKLKNGHKYVFVINEDVTADLSWIDLEDNASCELWIDVDANVIDLPTIQWVRAYWLDGALFNETYAHTSPWSLPLIGFRNHYSLRKEGSLIVGRLTYVTPIPE